MFTFSRNRSKSARSTVCSLMVCSGPGSSFQKEQRVVYGTCSRIGWQGGSGVLVLDILAQGPAPFHDSHRHGHWWWKGVHVRGTHRHTHIAAGGGHRTGSSGIQPFAWIGHHLSCGVDHHLLLLRTESVRLFGIQEAEHQVALGL